MASVGLHRPPKKRPRRVEDAPAHAGYMHAPEGFAVVAGAEHLAQAHYVQPHEGYVQYAVGHAPMMPQMVPQMAHAMPQLVQPMQAVPALVPQPVQQMQQSAAEAPQDSEPEHPPGVQQTSVQQPPAQAAPSNMPTQYAHVMTMNI